jgi:hypothetical protein
MTRRASRIVRLRQEIERKLDDIDRRITDTEHILHERQEAVEVEAPLLPVLHKKRPRKKAKA